jgi:hypothetical protein
MGIALPFHGKAMLTMAPRQISSRPKPTIKVSLLTCIN